MPRFASLFLDVDSTLCGVEGIDWLAERRGPDVAARVAEATERAMRGEIPLDAVYGERLALVRPGRDDLAGLARAYADALAPDAVGAIEFLRGEGVRLALVSGGIRQAIWPVARELGFALADVHAVDVVLDGGGGYWSYDAGSPLATQDGKRRVVADALAAGMPRPALAVGDGSTDVAMGGACDALAAFTGFARRDAVVRAAQHEVPSFEALVDLLMTDP
ncbi:HAD-IB family phosphatase [Roseisolibacter sp. H3M3-2]|uniref:HAD-IB family phosphatase n=1 Tax=Roseisolibacter sp. H3M3-2 TaxID=3031323 RepID=UPI0023DC80D0|nr:HAD-IB family phosphatase [Roseisolibacter sp. H3M3-2]MDF1501567.1 HAD-IB family phosphatase [Roseisolibacter sp. H3M3-2]